MNTMVSCDGSNLYGFKISCAAVVTCTQPAFRLLEHDQYWDIPEGWGRYLTNVLCPECLKHVVKKYGSSAVR